MNWEDLKDMYSDFEPLDIPNMAIWSMTGRAPDFDENSYKPPQVTDRPGLTASITPEQGNSLAYGGIGFGAPIAMTKIIGEAGGPRTIKAFHDKTGEYLGSLGYKDAPGRGAIFQSIESKSPRGTAELLGRFRDEMGPLMDNVKVPGPLKPQSIPAFESWVNRGRLDQWPNLKANFQNVIDQTKSKYGDLIPENTYQWNQQNLYR